MAERLTWSREPLAFIDLILLLRKYGTELDWKNILSSGGYNRCQPYHVLLSYLSNHGLARIPLDVLEVLKTTQKYVNGIALSLASSAHRPSDAAPVCSRALGVPEFVSG